MKEGSRTTEQVKIFTRGDKSNGFPHLEEDFNTWHSQHPDIEVIERVVMTLNGKCDLRAAQNNDDGCFQNVTIVVFYRKKTVETNSQ